MQKHVQKIPAQLEDLPNIGKAIATDLRHIGILDPVQLSEHEPLETFLKLADVMGHRHDPCVLYTLISVKHFFVNGETQPWWKFTEEGKFLLNRQRMESRH
jgi:DNA transformation protein